MNLQFYVEKLEQSDNYQKFIKSNPKAYLFAGFFVLELSENSIAREEQKLDYFNPKINKAITFDVKNLEEDSKESDISDCSVPPAIPSESNMDINEIQDILEKKMKEEKILSKIIKIIAVIQSHQENFIWNINAVLSTYDILKIHINDSSKEIIKFERKNLMDFMKKIDK